jgi:hypothetical protein
MLLRGKGLMKDCEQGVDEAGVGELESGGGELGGVGAGAGKDSFIGHFAEGESEGEGGDGEQGGAMELGGEGAGELGVGDRVRGGEVERAGEGGGFEKEGDGGESVGEGDPAHELTAAAEPATEAEAEDGEQAREGSFAAEDNAEAEVENADAGVKSGLSGGFPLPAEIGEKAGAGAGSFVEEFVAAVAVDSDGGGDEERLGRTAEAGEAGGKGAGGPDAACGDLALVGLSPAMGGEVCSGEMDGGGKAFKTLGVRDGRGGDRIPLELVGQGGSVASQLEDREITCGEGVMEGRAEHPRGTGEQNPGRWERCIDGTDVSFLLMNTIRREVGDWFSMA